MIACRDGKCNHGVREQRPVRVDGGGALCYDGFITRKRNEKMALIKCPECGKEISDQAAQCIRCGYPLPAVQVEAIRPERYVSVGAGQ